MNAKKTKKKKESRIQKHVQMVCPIQSVNHKIKSKEKNSAPDFDSWFTKKF